MTAAFLFLRKWWKPLGVLAILAAGVSFHYWAVWQAGKGGYAKRIAEERVEDEAAQKRHTAVIEAANNDYFYQFARVQAERDRLLANPVTRTLRVRVPTVCPEVPGDAGVPAGGAAEPVYVVVDDPGYGAFRDWLIRFSAGPDDGGRADAPVLDRDESRVAQVGPSDLF